MPNEVGHNSSDFSKTGNVTSSVENKARPPARQRAKNCVGGQGALQDR